MKTTAALLSLLCLSAPALAQTETADDFATGTLLQDASQRLILRTGHLGDVRLTETGEAYPTTLGGRDIGVFLNKTVGIRGIAYKDASAPNDPHYLEIHEWNLGDSPDFHSGRVSPEGTHLQAPRGARKPLPDHIARFAQGGMVPGTNPAQSQYAIAGMIVSTRSPQNLVHLLISPRALDEAATLQQTDQLTEEWLRQNGKIAPGNKAIAFQTPGWLANQGYQTSDKRGVLEVPGNAEIATTYKRGLVTVELQPMIERPGKPAIRHVRMIPGGHHPTPDAGVQVWQLPANRTKSPLPRSR